MVIVFYMTRNPPTSTRTDTLFPYTTLVRSGQVRDGRTHLGVVAPERLAPRRAIGRKRELADVERQRPALVFRQVRVADHRRPFQALLDDLRQREHAALARALGVGERSEEHTSELQSLMRISYAVFCLKKKTKESEKR